MASSEKESMPAIIRWGMTSRGICPGFTRMKTVEASPMAKATGTPRAMKPKSRTRRRASSTATAPSPCPLPGGERGVQSAAEGAGGEACGDEEPHEGGPHGQRRVEDHEREGQERVGGDLGALHHRDALGNEEDEET